MKIVINDSFGGFNISRAAFLRLRELNCQAALDEPDYGEYWDDGSGPREVRLSKDSFGKDFDRADALLIQVIEELGVDVCSGFCAHLKIVEIPDSIEYTIEEYDGWEHIAEKHKTWS